MNCKNCGAPVKGKKCEYCGTDYSVLHVSDIPSEESKKMMEIFSDGNMYVQEIIREPIIIDGGRNEDGILVPTPIRYKTQVKLVGV